MRAFRRVVTGRLLAWVGGNQGVLRIRAARGGGVGGARPAYRGLDVAPVFCEYVGLQTSKNARIKNACRYQSCMLSECAIQNSRMEGLNRVVDFGRLAGLP